MATYDPYIKRVAGDFIAADDWNEIQQRGRQDLAEHDHTGGLKGPKLTGDAIAADATLTVKRVNADEIKLADRLLGKRLSEVEDLATAALSAKGGAIDGNLTIGGDLTVKGKINGAVSGGGGGGGATFAVASSPSTIDFRKLTSFSTSGLSATITLSEPSIITATANLAVATAVGAELAFIATYSSTTRSTSVPFVPAPAKEETLDSETRWGDASGEAFAREISTSPPAVTQIDPRSYLKQLAAAAKLGDAGVGVGATLSTATALPISFTQVTALPAGTYTVTLVTRGTATLTSASVFVVTQIADLSPFDTIR